jgi:hypothetical protein
MKRKKKKTTLDCHLALHTKQNVDIKRMINKKYKMHKNHIFELILCCKIYI